MPITTVTIEADTSREIDLKNSASMIITTKNDRAKVYVNYSNDQAGSPIKEEADYSSPFIVKAGTPKIIRRQDLNIEVVRVIVEQQVVSITYAT